MLVVVLLVVLVLVLVVLVVVVAAAAVVAVPCCVPRSVARALTMRGWALLLRVFLLLLPRLRLLFFRRVRSRPHSAHRPARGGPGRSEHHGLPTLHGQPDRRQGVPAHPRPG